MTRAEFNAFCGRLPAATHAVQWGGAEVWKLGGKVFAIGRFVGADAFVTFKAGDIGYEFLKDQPGLRPAPYLASRGLKWVQLYDCAAMPETELRSHLRRSHAQVAAGLPRRTRCLLGLEEPAHHAPAAPRSRRARGLENPAI